ncbi:hypothetical protein [Silvibacterium dinghuense]|uniref:hypothetical protein n=1 Tax=Silvibacterium dinghuense TaxID=1560006 RepID=UPI0013E976E5|nr:hypothetical protein [Silvibacterium dinghuense]GGH08439.1 hypothetical protein GCM10011586_26000 [Silvibacterium dinghuense]
MKPAAKLTEVYRIPAVLAAITAVGLLSALLGDGVWDALSWLLLAVPVGIIAYCMGRPR